MLDRSIPLTRDLVLVGGGHTHSLLLLLWAMNPIAGVRVTLVNPYSAVLYTGMLPGYVAGHYKRLELDIDLIRLANHAGARMVLAEVEGLDHEFQTIHCANRADINYDVLSLNVGINASMPQIPGFNTYGHPAKPLDDFIDYWDKYVQEIRSKGKASIVVIGGGVAGIELTLAMAYRLQTEVVDTVSINIIESNYRVLESLNEFTRRQLLTRLTNVGVLIRCNVTVQLVSEYGVQLNNGEFISSNFIVGAAGAVPHPWLISSELVTENGFVVVDKFLRARSDSSVFAVGDCASMSHAPRPKAGVFAVRQAPVLFHNLRVALAGGNLRAYNPQRRFLKLITTGPKHAVASKFGFTFSGYSIWWLKDRIDRKFMNKFTKLPTMAVPSVPAYVANDVQEMLSNAPVLCHGCGAKVSYESLHNALSDVQKITEPGKKYKPGDDAAVLNLENDKQVVANDHLSAFIDDYWLFTKIAAIHSVNDIWAMGAKPHSALISVILPRMSTKLQKSNMTEIMHAAHTTLEQEGVKIIGGHTCQGAEMSIGFTIIGNCPDQIKTKAGAEPGNLLILTKPLGTGIIFSGSMRGNATGYEITNALDTMQSSSRVVAETLAPFATAMTDVTGFGLAGHLFEILDASNVSSTLYLDRIPFLQGAVRLAEAGIRSSLWESNASLQKRISMNTDIRSDILFDPQTAGGLLVSIGVDCLDQLMPTLDLANLKTSIIGRISLGPPWLTIEDSK